MKPRFKIGNVLRYEDNDTIDIFKVSQIQIDKETNEVKYISIFQETFIDDGNGSLELYKEQDKITDKISDARYYNSMLNPTVYVYTPTGLLDISGKDLPKTWEDVDMLVLTNKLPVEFKKRYAEICNIAYNMSASTSDFTWKHINFMKLMFLRDVYRGLEYIPDSEVRWYVIYYNNGVLVKSPHILLNFKESLSNPVLIFRVEEIRDLFFDNFKDLIEKCKEFI